MSESEILAAILLNLGSLPGIRLFRNSVGMAVDRKGHHITYGLCRGSADLIGWYERPVLGWVDDPTATVAVFVALEVKTPTGRVTEEQESFLTAVRRAGGIAAVVRSVEDARAVFNLT